MTDDTVVTLNPPHSQRRSTSNLKGSISMLFAAYPQNGNISTEDEAARLSIYLQGLTDLDPLMVAEACQDLIQSSRFMPSVAEIRERVGQIHDRNEPTRSRNRQPSRLPHDRIEQIVMTSDQGQRAIGIGCAGTLLVHAERNAPTEQHLRDWLNGLGEGYFRKRSRIRTENAALAEENASDPLASKIFGMIEAKETRLRQEYAQ